MLTSCGCTAVLMCGLGASGNRIGDAGGVAVAKALGSGQCQLLSLFLTSKSMRLAGAAR
eukprot:COSAG02_NODE_16278_length_1096_cov_10.225677_2_plen_59_part_00